MALELSRHRTVRPPFIAALAAVVLLAGIVAFERFGLVSFPGPSEDLSAAVLAGSVVKLTNEERAAQDLPALSANALLTRAAQMKADDMAEKSYYAHVSPDGTIPPYWLNQVGYKYQIMGENLVIDRTRSEDVVSAWMGSHDHRVNILNPSFTEIGIGVAYGRYKGEDTIYVVQMLAKPYGRQAAAALSAPARPAPVTVTIPAAPPRPAVPAPAPVRVNAATTTLVRPAAAPRTLADPLAPILEAVATSTLTLPEIATSSYPEPALGLDAAPPVEIFATATGAPAATRSELSARLRAFMDGVRLQVRSFFRP